MKTHTIHQLIATFLLLGISGCSNRAVELRYEAEKQFFTVERDLAKIQSRPEASDPEELRDIARRYGSLASFSYGALNQFDSSAHPVEHEELRYFAIYSASKLAQLYYGAGRFDTAIIILRDLVTNIRLTDVQKVGTLINMGEALQAEGKWDSALTVYEDALELRTDPTDDSGRVMLPLFNLPMHLLAMRRTLGDTSNIQRQVAKAEEFYLRLAERRDNPEIVAFSRSALARLYDGQAEWTRVIEQLSLMTDTSEAKKIEVQIAIANVYQSKLGQTARALDIYDSLRAGLSADDTLASPYIAYLRATALLDMRRYDDARNELQDLKQSSTRFFAASPLAQLALARTFEKGDNWKRAESEYEILIDNYRGSDQSMQAYLHLAHRYDSVGRADMAKVWYERGEKEMLELADREAGSPVEARALFHLAILYEQQDRWVDAAQAHTRLFSRFPDTNPGRQAIVRAGGIYRERLGDQAKSDSLFEVFKASLARVRPGWES